MAIVCCACGIVLLLSVTPAEAQLGGGRTATPLDDVIIGTSGPETLRGGRGIDALAGRGGNDRLHLGPGGSRLSRELALGGAGDDIEWAGKGAARLQGGPGDDVLHGGSGMDELGDGLGDDLVIGGAHGDYFLAGRGSDVFRGGRGGDRIDLRRDGRVDRVTCGTGDDGVYWIGQWDGHDVIAKDCEEVMIQMTDGRTVSAQGRAVKP